MPWVRYMLLAIFVSILAVSIAGILYTSHEQKVNNQRWCDVLVAIDDAYKQATNNPNVSAAGKHIAEEFHRLRVDFGC